jgi:Tfp pilus assembly protein PilO
MPKPIDQKIFTLAGVYVIIVLALVRFVVYPLHASLEEKKIILHELSETYRLKAQQYARQNQARLEQSQGWTAKEKDVAPYLYDRGMPFSSVQADMLENIISTAEKKGVTVLGFEMLDPSTGKKVSEVPVSIRMSGTKTRDLLDLLKALSDDKKTLRMRSIEMNRTEREIQVTLTLSGFRME